MNIQQICLIDDKFSGINDERYNVVSWTLSMVQAVEQFPMDKHSPEAFRDVYKQTQLADCKLPDDYDDDKLLEDIKRAFALHMLTLTEDDPLEIPDEWLIYDMEAYLMKELWF
ncbi:hypothetical protein ACMG5L_21455 [Escherichia coli]|uniref:hypothetical protein n=1 Tax=Escherichia coli TaxID=562 RepID=UPI0039BFEB82